MIDCLISDPSGFLDAFDGTAARALNQGTKFGAMLDQLTDRAALMCLLMVLGQLYPKYMLLFQVWSLWHRELNDVIFTLLLSF